MPTFQNIFDSSLTGNNYDPNQFYNYINQGNQLSYGTPLVQPDFNNSLTGINQGTYEQAILNPWSPTYGSSYNDNPEQKSTSNNQGVAAGNLVGGAIGAYEFIKGQQNINQLNKTPFPTYSVSPELQAAYGRAEGMSNVGFTPEEKAAYRSQLGSADALSYSRAINYGGGNRANDIMAGINSQNIADSSRMSIADAELRRKNMEYASSLAEQIQNTKNLASEAAISQRMLQEQSWGSASTAGLQSFANSFNIGGILSTAAKVAPLLA